MYQRFVDDPCLIIQLLLFIKNIVIATLSIISGRMMHRAIMQSYNMEKTQQVLKKTSYVELIMSCPIKSSELTFL